MSTEKKKFKRPHLNIGGGAGFKIDMILLTDCTGSMGSAISDVKTNFVNAYTKFLAKTGWDAEVGIAYYKDSGDVDPFVIAQEITDDTALLATAVASLNPTGGGDTPEGQLYALTELADRHTVGWRAGAVRVICWFGDQPGHDPVTIKGVTCTLTSTYEALLDHNIFVCAFSMNPPNNLNGTENQATKITNETNGVSSGEYFKSGVNQDGVTDTIFNFLRGHTP